MKRIYERADRRDGRRYLVDRLWPRGVTKAGARLDGWLKELAPSHQLRKWFGHRPERFDTFRRRYAAELALASVELDRIVDESRRHRVTLLYGARDPRTNHAVVLLQCLHGRMNHRSIGQRLSSAGAPIVRR